MKRRVVVTGMGGVTALGSDYSSIEPKLKSLTSAICYMPDWERFRGLNTKLAGPVTDFVVPEHYTRKQTRSMGRVSKMATVASDMALKQSGLLEKDPLRDGSAGIAYGSSTGSTAPIMDFTRMITENSMKGITATTYVQMMSHTTAVNVGLFFGLKGRVIPTSSACTSGSQAIGYSYESVRNGYQKIMVAGGGEELCPTEAAVFDTLFATSVKNKTPTQTPSPYDANRDGLVIGEGAGTLVLEELEHAQNRGAKILAEVVGFGTNCDAAHITHPEAETMRIAMELALKDAQLRPEDIDYVSGHATGTEWGDIAETQATYKLFGNKIPISSMKGYLGHTLGACGAVESWFAIEMMNRGWFAPTLNLKEVDPRCAPVDYVMGEGREIRCEYVMNNNFAFGGINTSIIYRRWRD